MRLLILSRKPGLYSTRRFAEAAEKIGHQTVIIDPLNCLLGIQSGKPSIVHHGKEMIGTDVVLPRIGSSITDYGLAVVRQFEHAGVPTVNSSLAINISRDKMRTLQLLAAGGIPVPATVLVRSPEDIKAAVDRLGGFPVIVKKVQGTQGVGIILAETMASLESYLETLWGLGQYVLIQQYIRENEGRDLRALVVNGKVVAAMRRQARPGEFRANVHRGGLCEPIDLAAVYTETALRTVSATGLQVAGVDMLETAAGPLVLEVNSSPGFEGIESATGVDVAAAILSYAASLASGVPA